MWSEASPYKSPLVHLANQCIGFVLPVAQISASNKTLGFPRFETTSGIGELERPEKLFHAGVSDFLEREVTARLTDVTGLFEVGPHRVDLVQEVLHTQEAKLA